MMKNFLCHARGEPVTPLACAGRRRQAVLGNAIPVDHHRPLKVTTMASNALLEGWPEGPTEEVSCKPWGTTR